GLQQPVSSHRPVETEESVHCPCRCGRQQRHPSDGAAIPRETCVRILVRHGRRRTIASAGSLLSSSVHGPVCLAETSGVFPETAVFHSCNHDETAVANAGNMNATRTAPTERDQNQTDVPAVSIRRLHKSFVDFTAVDGIDLDIRPGEVFGLLGPNGAGKTTTINMLSTLLRIGGGAAEIFGVDVAHHPHRVRQLIGVTGQYASVDEKLTGRENLRLIARLQGLSRGAAKSVAAE